MTGPGLAAALRAALDREIPGAVRLRRELHAGAELSGAEYRTAAERAPTWLSASPTSMYTCGNTLARYPACRWYG